MIEQNKKTNNDIGLLKITKLSKTIQKITKKHQNHTHDIRPGPLFSLSHPIQGDCVHQFASEIRRH